MDILNPPAFGADVTLGIGTTNVSGGVAQQLLYDNAGLLGELTKAASSVLVSDGSSVPSWSVTLPSGLAATNLALTTPILGTPQSGTLTNCTLPVGGISGLGSGIATWLATPSGANLNSALTSVIPGTAGGTGYNAGTAPTYSVTLTGFGGGASLGTSSATGTVLRVGKFILGGSVVITLSGTITATSLRFSLPATAANQNIPVAIGSDAGTGTHLFAVDDNATTTGDVYISSAANTVFAPVTGTTWRFTFLPYETT